ncbi:hypothetical protein NMS01_003808 [Vibrio cholerae]|uniref:hypothetical protein n=1 Tax=Vibrio cholerae TaxID=666 RepID=UPI001E2BA7F0|nr:hypothetical protein [Vibrio cholerae]EGR0050425.1 hypothetical protein [Vibrio vulnificus]EJL6329361.1 hypothetical protein [Vibrio cholerae]EJL6710290.1 hypothetical protein [Vibrio cholerae]EJL6774038.1 hypothetical protein [Vibrio cholerae]EJV2652522.1 hypothetical protein [Vibrio vulnificus]
MADIATISAVLGSLKTAHDLATIIKTSGNSLEQAEVKFKLADLIYALAEAKMELAKIHGLLIEKDEEIRSLRTQIDEKGNLVYEAPYYWLRNLDAKDGPFCQKCKDVDDLYVRLQKRLSPGIWHCTNCKTHVSDKDYKRGKV